MARSSATSGGKGAYYMFGKCTIDDTIMITNDPANPYVGKVGESRSIYVQC
ncbi:hypothetical protein Syun_012579 [Stephania yunnanensis]|uniref:Uncharacterized protein n=1 Tax=Stephania yunnanensis TaxID=152371 RepID=A0AAP0K0F9_9MAGN